MPRELVNVEKSRATRLRGPDRTLWQMNASGHPSSWNPTDCTWDGARPVRAEPYTPSPYCCGACGERRASEGTGKVVATPTLFCRLAETMNFLASRRGRYVLLHPREVELLPVPKRARKKAVKERPFDDQPF
jgi:hypothetical protein